MTNNYIVFIEYRTRGNHTNCKHVIVEAENWDQACWIAFCNIREFEHRYMKIDKVRGQIMKEEN